jgi:hypothetical protein
LPTRQTPVAFPHEDEPLPDSKLAADAPKPSSKISGKRSPRNTAEQQPQMKLAAVKRKKNNPK